MKLAQSEDSAWSSPSESLEFLLCVSWKPCQRDLCPFLPHQTLPFVLSEPLHSLFLVCLSVYVWFGFGFGKREEGIKNTVEPCLYGFEFLTLLPLSPGAETVGTNYDTS